MIYLHGIKKVPIKPFFQHLFQALTLKQTTNITKEHVNALLDECFSYQNYVVCLKTSSELCKCHGYDGKT